MVNAHELYRELKKRLLQAGLDDPIEANVLFETAVGARRAALRADAAVCGQTARELLELASRRVSGEPLQYIAGSWAFLDFELSVGPGVLIPRPETEQLALEAAAFAKQMPNCRALDLCSGSGCIAAALKRAVPNSEVTAVELSDDALPYLKKNVAALKCDVRVVQADIFQYDSLLQSESLELIVCNPPYVTADEYKANEAELKAEPLCALVAEGDALGYYRHIIPNYKNALCSGGAMMFETGCTQTEAVAALFEQCGYTDIRVLRDVFGRERNVCARKP